MRKFLCRHIKKPYDTGFVMGVKLGDWTYAIWLGYGRPIWWKPRFIRKGNIRHGFGFGWLLLCLQVRIIELKN